MNTVINKVGLEAEFFLRDKKGELLFPGEYGYNTDEFIILGEFRGKPGVTRKETVSNFLKEWNDIKRLSRKHLIDINSGYTEVTPEFYSKILRKMRIKALSHSKNIYPDVDILKLTDIVRRRGKMIKCYLSTGLHIHFSSEVVHEFSLISDTYDYVPIKPLFNWNRAKHKLYKRIERPRTRYTTSVHTDRITRPVLYEFVKKLDGHLLTKFNIKDIQLKYRNPGFYELKPWGFEYRSLPFNKIMLDNIDEIVDFSFNLLESLDLKE